MVNVPKFNNLTEQSAKCSIEFVSILLPVSEEKKKKEKKKQRRMSVMSNTDKVIIRSCQYIKIQVTIKVHYSNTYTLNKLLRTVYVYSSVFATLHEIILNVLTHRNVRNVHLDMCAYRRFRSFAQADLNLRLAHFGYQGCKFSS